MSVAINFNIDTVLNNPVYKFVILYIFILSAISGQQTSEETSLSFFKSVFVKLAINVLIFKTIINLEFIPSMSLGLLFTLASFLLIDK